MRLLEVVLLLGCAPREVPPPQDVPAPLGSPLASLAPATTTAPVVQAIPPTRQKNWPSPLALPCHQQSECGLAECDVASMMCAFPCRDDDDCVGSAQCNAQVGLCLP